MRLRAAFSTYWKMWFPRLSLAERGERVARRYLKRLRYKIVGRNVRGRIGELDIVAVDGRTVVFVEVKTRSSDIAGHPSDAVDEKKQEKLTRLALSFIRRHGLEKCSVRFDVVAVLWPAGAKRPKIEHFKNAFEAAW